MNNSLHNTLPHSIEAEKAVLGAILQNQEYINLIADKMKYDYFFLEAHRVIFKSMLELYSINEPIDSVVLIEKINNSDVNSEQLSPSYYLELLEFSPVAQNIEYHAEIVREKHYLRTLINACQITIGKAMGHEGKANEFVGEIEKDFLAITNEQDRDNGLVLASIVLENTITEIGERLKSDGTMTGVPSEFMDLDRVTGGWQKDDLVIVAARPAMGKSVFAANLALNAIKNDYKVAAFTLEMSSNQLMERLLANESKINASKFRKGDMSEEEIDRMMHGTREFDRQAKNLGIDDKSGLSLIELRSRCRRFKKEHGLDMIIIDYLQLMTTGMENKNDNREREIAVISAGLKGLAKELRVPVIALAQLNRGPDSRVDKVPKLSDLRESGSIEQDADMIMFLYRDEYYNPNSEDVGKAMVRIAKNRHGELDDIYLAFSPNFQKFSNLEL